ncbi:MAG: HAMP domain-containing histidine kinase [Bacteroidia bacterium]|nr:HAMP domain-containing histidine kinase [Bacteroidia bacterium]
MSSRTLFIFYILVGYILIQLGWWAWLLTDLNQEIYLLKNEVNLLTAGSPSETMKQGNELLTRLHSKQRMILGEGLVFLTFLAAGIVITRRSILKERKLAEQQRNFLLSVTHELRTPIASLKLQLETIQKRELDQHKKKELLQSCLHDTDRLNALVENILTATAIDQKEFCLQRREADLSAYLNELVEKSLRALAPSQSVTIRVESGIRFSFDEMAIASIVNNLLENAVKYSPPEGIIVITLKTINGEPELSVSDQGPGIPDPEKERIFERFYRGGNENTRKARGTGLGLFIVKFLVMQHNGSIRLMDNSPAGCIFTVRFRK